MAMKSFPLSGKRANANSSGSTTICTFQIPSLQCSSILAAGGSPVTTCSAVSVLPSLVTGSRKTSMATCTLPPSPPTHQSTRRRQNTRAVMFPVFLAIHPMLRKSVPTWEQSCRITLQIFWIGGDSDCVRRWSATLSISTRTTLIMQPSLNWPFCSKMLLTFTIATGKFTGC